MRRENSWLARISQFEVRGSPVSRLGQRLKVGEGKAVVSEISGSANYGAVLFCPFAARRRWMMNEEGGWRGR